MNEVFVRTDDNIKIAFNLYSNNREECVLICPGWFMTKDSKPFDDMAEEFSKTFDTAVMDFRGHGRSRGVYTFTSNEIKDLEAVIKYLRPKYKKLYLIGFSLGGALGIIYSASKNEDVDKLIAVSAPAEFWKIENRMWHPDAWIPTLFKKFDFVRWLTIRAGSPFGKKVKPIEVVKNIKCPTLFIAGSKDPTVLPWHTEKLFKEASCPKRYELFQNCRHAEDLFMEDRDGFMKLCLEFLKES